MCPSRAARSVKPTSIHVGARPRRLGSAHELEWNGRLEQHLGVGLGQHETARPTTRTSASPWTTRSTRTTPRNDSGNLDLGVADSFNEDNSTNDSGNLAVEIDGSFNEDSHDTDVAISDSWNDNSDNSSRRPQRQLDERLEQRLVAAPHPGLVQLVDGRLERRPLDQRGQSLLHHGLRRRLDRAAKAAAATATR